MVYYSLGGSIFSFLLVCKIMGMSYSPWLFDLMKCVSYFLKYEFKSSQVSNSCFDLVTPDANASQALCSGSSVQYLGEGAAEEFLGFWETFE